MNRVLTVRQPFAYLLTTPSKEKDALGKLPIKPVENRSWATPYRGRILIHTGQKGSLDRESLVKLLDEGLIKPNAELEFGGFIGYVDLIDIVRTNRSLWANAGDYHWILRNPKRMPFVESKGKLKLWSIENSPWGKNEK